MRNSLLSTIMIGSGRAVISILNSRTNWQVCGRSQRWNGGNSRKRGSFCRCHPVRYQYARLNGLETARFFGQEVPNAKILIMSQHDPVQILPGAIQAGAHGCVDKGHLANGIIAEHRTYRREAQPSRDRQLRLSRRLREMRQ